MAARLVALDTTLAAKHPCLHAVNHPIVATGNFSIDYNYSSHRIFLDFAKHRGEEQQLPGDRVSCSHHDLQRGALDGDVVGGRPAEAGDPGGRTQAQLQHQDSGQKPRVGFQPP